VGAQAYADPNAWGLWNMGNSGRLQSQYVTPGGSDMLPEAGQVGSLATPTTPATPTVAGGTPVNQTPAAPITAGNMLGYSGEQLASMPWLQALSSGIALPYYQGYQGPLSLSDVPGGQNTFGPGFPSVPAPHQLSAQTFLRMNPNEQGMLVGYYKALGISPDMTSKALTQSAPTSWQQQRTRWA
jgi:hypothetical protein